MLISGEEMVHVAGDSVLIDGLHVRQRCAWCGTTLVDYERSTRAVQGEPLSGIWPRATLIRVSANGAQNIVELSADRRFPLETCTRLDPAVTV